MAARFTPRGARRVASALTLLLAAGAGATTTSANAAQSIAYLDGKEVWVANLDGSSKTRLSGGQGDWTAVAQNDNGWIVGVELEAGKTPTLSRFTVWTPQGDVKFQGPLASKPGGQLYAYPLGLGVTADGGGLIYGYSYSTNLDGTLYKGAYLLPSSTVISPALGPYDNTSIQYVTIGANERLVGTLDSRTVGVQDVGGIASKTFTPFLSFNAPYEVYGGMDTSGDGTVMATSILNASAPGTSGAKAVHLAKFSSFGGTMVDDCLIDDASTATDTHGSISTDGTRVAWESAGGVKIAGMPALTPGGPGVCNLSYAPLTISATGSYPSLGGFDLNAYVAARTPATGGGTGGGAGGGGATGGAGGSTGGAGGSGGGSSAPALTAVLKSAPKLSTLTSKTTTVSVKLTASATGTAKIEVKIPPKTLGLKGKNPITLASGSAKVTAGKQKSVTLKPTSRAKQLRSKLKGKKATLRVKIGALTSETQIKLG